MTTGISTIRHFRRRGQKKEQKQKKQQKKKRKKKKQKQDTAYEVIRNHNSKQEKEE